MKRKLELIGRFFSGAKKFFVFAVVASLMTTIFNAITPQLFRFTIDSVLTGDKYPWLAEHIWVIALVLVGVAFLSGIATFTCKYFSAKAGENFAENMRNALFIHVQKLPMNWHDKNQTGDIIQRCTSDVEVIRNFIVTQLLEVFRTVFLISVSFTMMVMMNVKLSLIVLMFVPIVVAYSGIFYRLIAKRFQFADEAEGELSTVVQENATGVRVVRAFGREKYEMDRFQEKNDKFANLWIKLGTLSGLYWGVGDLITGLQVITIIVLGAIEAVHGNITVGEFIAFASYNTTLVWPVRGLGRILSDMSKAGVSFDRVDYIIHGKEEAYENQNTESENKKIEKCDIQFSDVSFSYEEGKEVLNDVSFTIPQGTIFGILGGTGSGKSTIVQLLDRFYELENNQGTITVGDMNIKDIPLEIIRRNIAQVLQEPFLYSKTIRENIALANADASFEDIRNAAKIACVDDAIMNFVDGYDTIVGERGVTLSGGQRQRIAIARMLLQKAPIMVFDDSLSAVDSETDYLIRKALKEHMKGSTVILISHRITTLMSADHIVVLKEGKIAEEGTHYELIEKNGIYHQIYEIQMSHDDRKEVSKSHGSI